MFANVIDVKRIVLDPSVAPDLDKRVEDIRGELKELLRERVEALAAPGKTALDKSRWAAGWLVPLAELRSWSLASAATCSGLSCLPATATNDCWTWCGV